LVLTASTAMTLAPGRNADETSAMVAVLHELATAGERAAWAPFT
jgi:hypothetical protein